MTMLPTTPLQATGGSPLVIALVFISLLLTVILSLAVAYLLLQGYRRNRDAGRLALAVGLVLLTTVPFVAQFVLTNVTSVPSITRSAVANASKFLGLVAMLYAIYGVSRSEVARQPVEENPTEGEDE